MPTYTKTTGDSGVMEIRDDGQEYVEFWLTADTDSLIPALPWTYILNGVEQPWKTIEFARGGYPQRIALVRVTTSQTVTFIIGESGSPEIGGPVAIAQYINRETTEGTVRIKVGTEYRNAIPYVNVEGVWKQAEPWAKSVGEWKQTT